MSAVHRAGGQGGEAEEGRRTKHRDALPVRELPVGGKCLRIPRNDPMEQSDYIIFSGLQCTVMAPDGKGQNPALNSVLTLTRTTVT